MCECGDSECRRDLDYLDQEQDYDVDEDYYIENKYNVSNISISPNLIQIENNLAKLNLDKIFHNEDDLEYQDSFERNRW